jgi:hypothetical protein
MENREKIIIDYYNIIADKEATDIGHIPEDKLEIINASKSADLLRGIIIHERKKNLTFAQIANKYNANANTLIYLSS